MSHRVTRGARGSTAGFAKSCRTSQRERRLSAPSQWFRRARAEISARGGCHVAALSPTRERARLVFLREHHTETRSATGPNPSPHRDDAFFHLHHRRRRRACRAVAPLGVALGVSSVAHHQMCGARAAIELGGAARDPPRVRRGRRAPRRRPRVVHRGGTRVRAPPARCVPRTKPRLDARRARERSLIVHLGRDGRTSAFSLRPRDATARRRVSSPARTFGD